ncbi:UPF0020 domain-containing protein [Haematococcus lacustris]|uniref:UPF0020 domain-containing protein n=1 Tax=Haematococcus lacustris TaxID=44745 RepID=A0A699Z6G8_HAELA|nr:UPF0020 domain-containing protein [Haematococcus lacustris]
MFFPLQGKVQLKRPDVKFWLMIVNITGTTGHGDADMVPYRLYFGRIVAEYNHVVAQRYALSSRPFIGPTSMNAEMAFIMCNQAQVRAGQLVLDPYMGTGSIGVAMAYHGAQVMGTDVDMKVIKLGKTTAKGEHVNVYSNFQHYGTRGRLAGLLRLDLHTHPFRRDLQEGAASDIALQQAPDHNGESGGI